MKAVLWKNNIVLRAETGFDEMYLVNRQSKFWTELSQLEYPIVESILKEMEVPI